MDDEELFKVAVDTRKFEIQMFWQRSNYFMVLNTAIAIGFFSGKAASYTWVLALFGAAVSLLWYLVTLGGKYWQSRWEHAASRFEKSCAPDAKLFSATPDEAHAEVAASLQKNDHRGFQRWLDSQILKKPSVSYQMTLLSFAFFLFWGIAFIVCICVAQGH